MAQPPGLGDQRIGSLLLGQRPWHWPMVGVAAFFTVGVLLDHQLNVPFPFALLLGACALIAFVLARLGGRHWLALLYLACATVAAGSAYHAYRAAGVASDDIAGQCHADAIPATVRGFIEDEPRRWPPSRPGPLRSMQGDASAWCLVRVTAVLDNGQSRPASGLLRLVVHGPPATGQGELLASLHPGDEIEVVGLLSLVPGPSNPGEFNARAYWNARGVRAVLMVHQGDAAISCRAVNWHWSVMGWAGQLRATGHRSLGRKLGHPASALARALLLGEGAPMTPDDWGKFVRTGVIHVIAISGQHLVLIGFCLTWLLQRCCLGQRWTLIVVALILIAYALVTGGRPSALRAAAVSCALSGGLLLGRGTITANVLALAWLSVLLVRPGDIFDPGCQLSFLGVILLAWGCSTILAREVDPLEQIIEQSMSWPARQFRHLWRGIRDAYLVNLIVWLGITPLAAYYSGVLALPALLLGPPLVALISLALVVGFATLLLCSVPVLGTGLAFLLDWLLRGSDMLVQIVDSWDGHFSLAPMPLWWALVYSLGLVGILVLVLGQRHWYWVLPTLGLAWLALGLVVEPGYTPPATPRITFLAVGHGGCIVLQLPDGKVLLYDAGSLRGPPVAGRIIVPFLRHQGIRRIDEVLISHSDLDHINALAEVARELAIGRVLTTASFADRDSKAVEHVLGEFARRKIPVQQVAAGDQLQVGGVALDVLHPPEDFREGNANARSMVVEARWGTYSVLLTGDLEGPGLPRLLQQPPRRVNVLQAPHHGSTRLDVTGLLNWCQPSRVISCQAAPRTPGRPTSPYARTGQDFWTTHDRGAITIEENEEGLVARPFLKR